MIQHSLAEHTRSLAAYLPNGDLFAAKNLQDSNLNQLLRGLAGELFTAEGYLITLEDEYFPDQTALFLSEWEQALGIPDDCFPGTGSNSERRSHILAKLTALGVQTVDDFVALAALFGVSVAIRPGIEGGAFPIVFPMVLFDSPAQARFTIIVTFTVTAANRFPLVLPLIFGTPEIATLECLFGRVAPTNCNLIFEQV